MRANKQPEERGIEHVGEILARGLTVSTERHDRVRLGEAREEIPQFVRVAVWCRDKGRCEHCGERVEGPWEMDHIYPWSAGGSNLSSNLRVLCQEHNQERSNHVDPTERLRLPVTWWCLNCCADGAEFATQRGETLCGHHWGGGCRALLGYQRHFEKHGEFPTWFERGPVEREDATTRAYCAHCGRIDWTDRPL